MFELLPENAAKGELEEKRARDLRRFWQGCKLLLTLSAFGIGAVALLIGLVLLGVTLWVRPQGPQVRTLSGTVVRLAEKKMHRRGPDAVVYAPVVRFTVDGQEREFTGRLATRPSPWTVGETVEVLYDPVADRPELVGWKTWRFAAEMSAAGAAMLAMGVVLRRRRWWAAPGLGRRDAKSPPMDDAAGSRLLSAVPATAFRTQALSTTRSAPERPLPRPEPPPAVAPDALGLSPELGDTTATGRAIRFVVAAAFCGAPAGYLMLAPGFVTDVLHFGHAAKSPMADLIGSWAWPVGLTVGFVAGCCGAVWGDRFVAPVVRFYRRR